MTRPAYKITPRNLPADDAAFTAFIRSQGPMTLRQRLDQASKHAAEVRAAYLAKAAQEAA